MESYKRKNKKNIWQRILKNRYCRTLLRRIRFQWNAADNCCSSFVPTTLVVLFSVLAITDLYLL